MGSIQPFPPRGGPGTIADVWRAGPVPGSGVMRVRMARLADYAAMRALQRLAQPGIPTLTLRQFESRRQAFAEGQLVAECEGVAVGAASALVVPWDDGALDPRWGGITGDGFFTTHDPLGRTLYATDMVSDATRRGFGVARALHQALRRLCRRMNLRRIAAAARLPGYAGYAHEMSAELYARRVIWGELDDPVLRFHLAQGFQFCATVAGYLPEDAQSCGHAALFVWLNPMYVPPGPGARAQDQRQRKCA